LRPHDGHSVLAKGPLMRILITGLDLAADTSAVRTPMPAVLLKS
jgi:hypothetical protein